MEGRGSVGILIHSTDAIGMETPTMPLHTIILAVLVAALLGLALAIAARP